MLINERVNATSRLNDQLFTTLSWLPMCREAIRKTFLPTDDHSTEVKTTKLLFDASMRCDPRDDLSKASLLT